MNKPAHFPANPEFFAFGADVAPIFDDMAQRSLPLYSHAYTQITAILRAIGLGEGDAVWDMGVSTGAGLLACRAAATSPYVAYHGVDVSGPMLDVAREKCPWADLIEFDFMGGVLPDAVKKTRPKVIIWGWTLQFLPEDVRQEMLKASHEALAPDGVLFVMEKWRTTCEWDAGWEEQPEACFPQVFQDQYINWRRDNGYSLAEITAKNRALASAMKVNSRYERVMSLIEAGFSRQRIYGLFQLFNFGGLVAQKHG